MHAIKPYLICKALGDEKRMAIVLAICDSKEICACKLLEIVDCTQSTLSHHMKILVDSQLVIAKEVGKWTHYSLNNEFANSFIVSLRDDFHINKGECNCNG